MRHDSPAATAQTSIQDLPVDILSHIASYLDHESATNLSRELSRTIIDGKIRIYEYQPGTHSTLADVLKTPEEFFWEKSRPAIFFPNNFPNNLNSNNFYTRNENFLTQLKEAQLKEETGEKIKRLIQLANQLDLAKRMKNKIEKLNNDLISLLKKQSTLSSNLRFLMPELPENANDNDKLKYELERLQYVYTALCLFEMDEDAYNSVKRKPILKQTYEIIAEYGHYVSGLFLLPCLGPAAGVIAGFYGPITAIIFIACLLFVATMLCMPVLIDSQRSTHKRIRDADAWDGWQSSEDENRRHHNRHLSELVDDVRLNKSKTASQARAGIHHSLFVQSRSNSFSLIRKDSKFKSSYTQAAKRAETQIMSQLNPSRV